MYISIYQFYLCPQIRMHAPLILHTHPDLQAASCRDATMYPVGQQASCNHRLSSRGPPQAHSSQRYANSLVHSSHLSHSLTSMQPLPSGVRPCQLHPHHLSRQLSRQGRCSPLSSTSPDKRWGRNLASANVIMASW